MTHADAAESGLGEVQSHVEAAIAAYEGAVTISPDVAKDTWVGAQCDLAVALQAAAAWRGPSALRDSADVYGAVLDTVTKEAAPELWASLNVQYAHALVAGGDVLLAGDAVTACERALEIFTRETSRNEWAQIQLRLGELFRARPDGDRADNLERAAAALDAALSVFTREEFPDEWLRAHYNRGPVLVFRSGGDRDENLRCALKSLSFAVDSISRDDAPELWAPLQVTIAQALLDRSDGDPQERIEEAIRALKSALLVLPEDKPSLSWTLAERFLGEAYLLRAAGDEDDNIDSGITALEKVQGWDTSPADLDSWTVAQANLGQAYMRRRRGERALNRAKAVAALQSVVEVPVGEAVPPQGWGSALAWLALLSMYDAEHDFGPGDRKLPDEGADDGLKALAAFYQGHQPLALDPHWRVPFHLEQDALVVERQFRAFLNTGTVPARPAGERSELEVERHDHAWSMVFQLEERRSAGLRTNALFADIQAQGRPFVLFLRGFNNRIARFASGSVVSGTGNLEWFALTRVVESVAPMPVVWMANPVESGGFDLIAFQTQEHVGFRVEAEDGWEQNVRALISAASFVVMHNSEMTPGVLAEIAVLGEACRLDDTFFQDAEAANRVTGRVDCRPLNSTALAEIRAHTTPRTPPASLPVAMCRWIEGSRRTEMEREAEAVEQLVERLEETHQSVLNDLVLDASSWSLSYSILLERRSKLPGLFARQSAMFERLAGEFDQAAGLAESAARCAKWTDSDPPVLTDREL